MTDTKTNTKTNTYKKMKKIGKVGKVQSRSLTKASSSSVVGIVPTTSTSTSTSTRSSTITTTADRFPQKLHKLLWDASEAGWDDIISWSSSGKSFKVHKKDLFVALVMPKYLNNHHHHYHNHNHSGTGSSTRTVASLDSTTVAAATTTSTTTTTTTKSTRLSPFKTFQRNCNLWGFLLRTTDKSPNNNNNSEDSHCPNEKGWMHHPLFVRDQPDLCRGMTRTRIKGLYQRTNGRKPKATASSTSNVVKSICASHSCHSSSTSTSTSTSRSTSTGNTTNDDTTIVTNNTTIVSSSSSSSSSAYHRTAHRDTKKRVSKGKKAESKNRRTCRTSVIRAPTGTAVSADTESTMEKNVEVVNPYHLVASPLPISHVSTIAALPLTFAELQSQHDLLQKESSVSRGFLAGTSSRSTSMSTSTSTSTTDVAKLLLLEHKRKLLLEQLEIERATTAQIQASPLLVMPSDAATITVAAAAARRLLIQERQHQHQHHQQQQQQQRLQQDVMMYLEEQKLQCKRQQQQQQKQRITYQSHNDNEVKTDPRLSMIVQALQIANTDSTLPSYTTSTSHSTAAPTADGRMRSSRDQGTTGAALSTDTLVPSLSIPESPFALRPRCDNVKTRLNPMLEIPMEVTGSTSKKEDAARQRDDVAMSSLLPPSFLLQPQYQ